eukprot:TRINITY_DN5750_c0_g2_i4.p1 TRINITY_DN5750_c0_g2~~TRINITY_DN5750_c0_g2_i4.p1  ORF type:complete len:470 (-),score=116.82 TRINITY_DN5750_c0_g2_i4:117-1496(-)
MSAASLPGLSRRKSSNGAAPRVRSKSEGMETLRLAIQADEAGDTELAKDLYEQSSGILLAVLKASDNEKEKRQLRSHIESAITRAEAIKSSSRSASKRNVNAPSASKSSSRPAPAPKVAPAASGRSTYADKARSAGVVAPPKKSKVADAIRRVIEQEVLDDAPGIKLADVSGLANVKQSLYEAIVYPSANPELFTGLRAPPKGILLFGPPGNGKTMIAKAVASECDATFFNISASVLTSKYVGEGEKLVRGLFEIARERQPSIIFIDEIDSILTARSADDNEASRRLKTEFLVAFDGVGSSESDRILVMAATNLPDSLDEAVKRRFSRRIYVPLPDPEVRIEIIRKLFKNQKLELSRNELQSLIAKTEGYSASDLKELCKDAAMVPLRRIDLSKLSRLSPNEAPAIRYEDFLESLQNVKPTVSEESLKMYDEWNELYGTKLSVASSSKAQEEDKNCKVS